MMFHFVKVPAAVASAALAIVGANLAAKAEDLPAEGKFSITYTSVNSSPIKPVMIGKDKRVRVGSYVMSAVNDSGTGLLNNMGGQCNQMAIVDLAAQTFESHGYCTYTDDDKDQIFEKYDFASQGFAPVATATGKWLGGTGKYAGLQGDIEITNVDVASFAEGISQSGGKKTGTYKIVK